MTSLHSQFRMIADKFAGHKHWCDLRAADLQITKEHRRDPLVDEDSAVLRIILRLDDVEVTVVSLDQMRLRAAFHPAQPTAGSDGHP